MRMPSVRFSVRLLMALILIVAVVLGRTVHTARVQREAVAAIQGAGGKVYYIWWWVDADPNPPDSQPAWQRWLVASLDKDYLGHPYAVYVSYYEGSADNAVMQQVGRLKSLEVLSLPHGRRITDFAPIRGLSQLKLLHLGESAIDDAGLAHLAGLSRLESLALRDTRITDAGIAHLRYLKALTHLDVSGTRITDAALPAFAGYPDLLCLWLNETEVTDRVLAQLSGLKQLALLFLDGTRITDAGIAQLQGLDACEQITVGETAVTDAAITRSQRARPMTKLLRGQRTSRMY